LLLPVSDKGVESEKGGSPGENGAPHLSKARGPMDTKTFCVYNLARGVFLSSKVTVADCASEPLKVLKVLVSGLGLDAVSGLWLSPLYAAPAIPRLFPFDLLYLDRDHQVVDEGEILPGVEFPPFRHDVASALVLARQTLQSTQTARGDRLIIGLETEIERQIAAFDSALIEPVAVSPELFGNGHRELMTSGRSEAISPAAVHAVLSAQVLPTAIAEPESCVMVAEPTDGDAARHQSLVSLPSINGQLAKDVVPEAEISAANACLTTRVQPVVEIPPVTAQGPEEAKADSETENCRAAIGEWLLETDVTEIATKAAINGAAKRSTETKAPVITITEVLLERPPGSPVNGQHGGIEDLFSNWVDAPVLDLEGIAHNPASAAVTTDASVAPVLPEPVNSLEASSESKASETLVLSLTPDPVPVEKEAVAVLETHAPREEEPQLPAGREEFAAAIQAGTLEETTVSEPEPMNSAAPVTAPVITTAAVSGPTTRMAIPQPPLATTFTFAQYGMWSVSAPTAVRREISQAANEKAPDLNRLAEGLNASERVLSSPGTGELKQEKASVRETADAQQVLAGATAYTVSEKTASQPTPAAVAIAESLAMKPSVEKSEAALGQVSMLAAASVRPIAETPRSAMDRLPESIASANAQASDIKVSVAIPENAEISRREVPGAEAEGRAVQIAEAAQRKPVNSQEMTPANTAAASKQPDNKKESASTPQSALSLTLPLPGIRKTEQKGKLKISIQRVDTNGKAKEQPLTLGMRFKRWLNPVAPTNSDRRKAHRRYVPGMVAHYYTGGAPKPHDVADISMTGFYLLTEDRWMPETMIQMTLQKPCAKGERKQSITVLSKIVRRGSDGVAAQFVMPETLDPTSRDIQPSQATDRFALARFL